MMELGDESCCNEVQARNAKDQKRKKDGAHGFGIQDSQQNTYCDEDQTQNYGANRLFRLEESQRGSFP